MAQGDENKEMWEGMYHAYPVAVKVIKADVITESTMEEVTLLAYAIPCLPSH